jgi:hypothetical protein
MYIVLFCFDLRILKKLADERMPLLFLRLLNSNEMTPFVISISSVISGFVELLLSDCAFVWIRLV